MAMNDLGIRDIQRCVCAHYGVSVHDMLRPGRVSRIVGPRHVAMYLARMLTKASLPMIAREFMKQDHTTVLHAIRKVQRTRVLELEAQLLMRVLVR